MKLAKGHANMERMEEEIPDSEYRAHQHFITNSEWDYEGVIAKVATDTSHLMKVNKEKSGQPTGLIIDESAHLKKGDKSIGVCPQYAGVVGKVENCQVGVYASLINDNRTTLIDESLFLPAKWAKNRLRCQKAGVLEEHIQFKTKPQLALEMIDRALDLEVAFDWVGGDGLYGHNSELRNGLQSRGLFYVLDVHKDEKVFTERPVLEVPNKSHKRGRPTKKAKPNIDPIRVDQYIKDIKDEEWCIENKIRKTHKGWKKLKVHTCKIWLLQNEQLQELTLLITQTMDGKKETKYSFSNGGIDQYAAKEYAYFQCQRYWVERAFDDAKNELGMSDYQVRKWNGWHHHHALVLMASLYLLIQKIDLQEDAPLISVRDARILMIVRLFGTDKDMQKRLKQMEKRHLKRQFDIDRYYIGSAEKLVKLHPLKWPQIGLNR
ncbi:MAG: IS701 family transposase [Saprospiraceae bacterium]|nr:IS701 family transposase [Saprospiraceae bacterium]